jgi:hypothetical protein
MGARLAATAAGGCDQMIDEGSEIEYQKAYEKTYGGQCAATAREVEALKREIAASFWFLHRPIYALLDALMRIMEWKAERSRQ